MNVTLDRSTPVLIERVIRHGTITRANPRGTAARQWLPTTVQVVWERVRVDDDPWGPWGLKAGHVSGPNLRHDGIPGRDLRRVPMRGDEPTGIDAVDTFVAATRPADAEVTA